MSKRTFSKEEIETLRKNRYVKRVSEKAITYTDEFKHQAIEQSEKGLMSTAIFDRAGFELTIIGRKRAQNSLNRWKRSYKDSGVMGLRDRRTDNSGRPLERELSLEEQLEREKAKRKFLEVQLEFLKKLDMIERGVYTPKGKKK